MLSCPQCQQILNEMKQADERLLERLGLFRLAGGRRPRNEVGLGGGLASLPD